MAEPRPSIRTARARISGLGPAHHGTREWWMHRVTAVANVPLVLAFVVIVAMMAGRPYPEAAALVSHPLVAILLILGVLSVTNHMRMGLQIVIEDYVHDKGLRIAAVIANNFYCVVVAVACLYAIVRVSLRAFV
ncbi:MULTISPECIES: succinate dehydrogenase, hydrophobic membrane anchor protein [Methylobacterium]|jgi:succinate dehydrogenase / fumarate reductase membrane anchor subunit|uniref:Succinate dehydrogenase hydrophobic membrane anchor subunit n=2 Tax=Methylobacterium TaxID=407 RepID=A0A0C6FR37_9HYPH|nr:MULTISPECIES: succinate dehydrogenase, hydrophobic membrane anchor protein [Methylobacterium]MBZ6413250.1 succinate dehydrogenase, hydrophobic membrane anchor protein [Methylobacterium sp.]MBK3399583.1 succinate dehydrogenase, hydrophobic membrane anchor protein [Methylobacterium ajmalii]MBK3408554.1 succinate dehydrogenase, hydrophobic membrane anchor protein [Methylobacterium ajmalii]MBK3425605.1 succinate dehydrogenase, hydrophobic membrane anchor protein [Methylobacterium ajmalii]SFF461